MAHAAGLGNPELLVVDLAVALEHTPGKTATPQDWTYGPYLGWYLESWNLTEVVGGCYEL